jgi:hypothetical protein
VPLALLTFNLGVEAGQLVFVAAMIVIYRAAMTMTPLPFPPLRTAMAYGIGAAASFWLLTRLGAFIV